MRTIESTKRAAVYFANLARPILLMAGLDPDPHITDCKALAALLATTVEYTRTRVQFGRPLAANQVLRHRMADMSIALDESRSVALGAVVAVDDALRRGDAAASARAAAGARAKVGACARRVTEEAVQLHGGMGVTQELAVGSFMRR